ncbi:MAG: polysaccharide biosynthesis protein, partial [Oscillospiraceae bacterium]|nr:polysaccharide biosynthesis protein [Oscillospiraceae bacterium]
NKDIKIVFTGLRPGEKLFEELRLEEESTTRTANKKIFINKPIERDVDEFAKTVKRLQNSIHEENINEMFDLVRELVETFQHDKAYERD